jgi:endonuclease YncB( thermonuclease family)
MSRHLRCFVTLLCGAACVIGGCASRQGAYHPSYRGALRINPSEIRFDDGDTFLLSDHPIRILGVDTPEIAHPKLGMDVAQPYGVTASESTRVWILRARTVEYVPDGWDRYGRRLAHVFVDGELLSVRLLRAGLAYETISHYGDSGFPELAQAILDAARDAPRPKFEEPYRWKRKHRKPPAH